MRIVRVTPFLIAVAAILGACSTSNPATVALVLEGVLVDAAVSVEPAFRPDIHDYNVWCEDGQNTVSISLASGEELPEAQISKWGSEDRTVKTRDGAVRAQLSPGDLLSVGAYHFRCLPTDFPRLSIDGEIPGGAWVAMGLIESRFTNHDTSNPRLGEYAVVIDEHGAVVWYQKVDTPMNVTPVDRDRIAWLSDTAQMGVNLDPNKTFEVHSFTSEKVSAIRGPAGWAVDFHELEFKDDKIYGIVTQTRDNQPGYDARVVIDGIAELTPGHEALLFDSSEHIDPLETDRGVLPLDPPLVEPVHMNSVQVLDNGDFLVCARNLNEVFLVSNKTKKVAWRIRGAGSPPVQGNKDGAVLLNVPQGDLFRQAHDARLAADGTLSIFDNHTGTPSNARVVLYQLDLARGEASAVSYRSSENRSDSVGSARVFQDGFVVSWGDRLSPLVEMVEKSGESLFSVRGEGGVITYRAIPVAKDFFDADTLRRSVK